MLTLRSPTLIVRTRYSQEGTLHLLQSDASEADRARLAVIF